MTLKSIARKSGQSGRVNISSELEMLDFVIGDYVDIDIADSREIAHTNIKTKDKDCFLIITPR
jgi:hypothetical protein